MAEVLFNLLPVHVADLHLFLIYRVCLRSSRRQLLIQVKGHCS
jgi:hypothetical protein